MSDVAGWRRQQSVAAVSAEALRHNARVIRQRIGAAVKLCAMVKADAYGHGAAAVAEALCGGDERVVDVLAVANVGEAAALPAAVARFGTPVLVLRPMEEGGNPGGQRDEVEAAVRNGWGLTVCGLAAARDVARAAGRCGRTARVEVMVDTGMGRGGVSLPRAGELIHEVRRDDRLALGGVYTHFANAEEAEDPMNARQLAALLSVRQAAGLHDVPFHAANTAAVFNRPAAHLDMVRVGIGTYGVGGESLRPVMRWTTRIIAVNDVAAGDPVGYCGTWRANRPSRVGLLPVGYADGYSRSFSNRASVEVRGQAAPVAGRVSMDLTTIDLTDVPQARVGDEVVLLSDDPASAASVDRLAEIAGTIPYEVFCRIGQRTERVLVGADAVFRQSLKVA